MENDHAVQSEVRREPSVSGDLAGIEYLPRLLSGVQPSSLIHIGHYFGALRQHINLQHEYPGQMFICIADYHSLTRTTDLNELRAETIELATVYLALDLDVQKCVLYRQSDVPHTFELFWILSCLSPISELLHLRPIHNADEISAALLGYPVLMAADVLTLRATHVPVGSDQRLNLERVRDLARRFTTRYGPLLPCPEILTTDAKPIPGTDGRKMNAKLGNAIGIFEHFPRLREKVNNIVTDSKGKNEPKDPDNCNVFRLYTLVATPEQIQVMRDQYTRGPLLYSDAKRTLTHAIQEYFAPRWDHYQRLKARPDDVMDVLRFGLRAASQEAEMTIDAVRQMVGISS